MEQPNDEARVSLTDLLNYEPENYLNDGEVKWIKDTFKGNRMALNILRKILLPTALDLPIELLVQDSWFKGGADYSMLPEKEAKSIICARQDAIKFISGGLIALKNIAEEAEESPQQAALRREKDSPK